LKNSKNAIIFTDLDGTLLDRRYSTDQTQPAVDGLLSKGVKIVFCSSKTKKEIEFYREKMGIRDPFISENGAAIYVPKEYFNGDHAFTRSTTEYDITELGVSYSKVRRDFLRLRNKYGLKIVGFGDLETDQISAICKLSPTLSALAKQREYTEPFFIEPGEENAVFKAMGKENLNWMKGDRCYHLVANHDKGKATNILRKMYVQELGDVVTIGVGNGLNDVTMLQRVNFPFLVKERSLRCVWEEVLSKVLLLNQ
jgi:mannosyl-3-phosphoglycerate phosphatase